ncbi:hypothetical protein FB446DRAFT_710118, partial [Lentinula raphanica]
LLMSLAEVPFQDNTCDCGVHILWHLKHVLHYGQVWDDYYYYTVPVVFYVDDHSGGQSISNLEGGQQNEKAKEHHRKLIITNSAVYNSIPDSGERKKKQNIVVEAYALGRRMYDSLRPISSDFGKDIVLLSALLVGPPVLTSWSMQYETGRDHSLNNWQQIVSILLNIDNVDVFHSVAGVLTKDIAQCVVYSSHQQYAQERVSRRSTSVSEGNLKPDGERGGKLLQDWPSMSNKYTPESHVRDIFDIIEFIRCNPEHKNSSNLVSFIHLRVAPRMHRLMKDLGSFWGGSSPFIVVEQCLPSIQMRAQELPPRPFEISLNNDEIELLREFKIDYTKPKKGRHHRFSVAASNLANWIELLKTIWQKLEERAQVIISSNSDVNQIKPNVFRLSAHVCLLYRLHPIWVYVISLPILELREAWAKTGML